MAQQPSTNDELLALKKRARRRLVGAVALVLISMIVLWNVLDSEPRAARQNVNAQGVEIISDAPQLGPAPGNGAPAATPASPLAAAPAMPVPQPPAAVVVEAPEAARSVTPETRKPAAPEPRTNVGSRADSPPPEKPAKHDKPKAEPKPEPVKPLPKPAEPREKEPVNKPVDTRSDDGKSHVIQVAALADADKAKALVAKLAGNGVKAYTEQKGEVTRVRVGPFSTREQAEKTLSKIQSAGASGMIISR